MAHIRPFTGLLYNKKAIDDFSNVVAPPYDVITPEQQEQLYQKHPNNIIRLILGKEEAGDNEQESKYTRAADYLATWQEENVLTATAKPAVYFYTQDYRLSNGENRCRKGFIARIKLEDFTAKVVLPHEKTMSKPKADRLNLTVACRANFNPIFTLYSDPDLTVEHHVDSVAAQEAYLDVTDKDGVRHQLWVVDDGSVIQDITDMMVDKAVLIADGHHRYETALNYRNLMREQNPGGTGDEAYNYTMMYFSNMNDVGLVILPTHRLVKNIQFDFDTFSAKAQDYFTIEKFVASPDNDADVRKKTMAALAEEPTTGFACAIYTQKEKTYAILRLKDPSVLDGVVAADVSVELRGLDAYILEALIFQKFLGISCSDENREDHIGFAHDDGESVEMVQSGAFEAVFLVNPTRIEQVRDVVTKGEIMPQKSTYFYPKLLSGLTINQIES